MIFLFQCQQCDKIDFHYVLVVMATITDLPKGVIEIISYNLTQYVDIASLSQTCRKLH